MMPQTESELSSVGNSALDAEHRALMQMLAEALEACRRGALRDELFRQAIRLRRYLRAHFVAEEGWLDDMDYPMLEQHRQQHAELLEDVDDFIDAARAGHSSFLDLFDLLSDILREHVAGSDASYAAWFLARQRIG